MDLMLYLGSVFGFYISWWLAVCSFTRYMGAIYDPPMRVLVVMGLLSLMPIMNVFIIIGLLGAAIVIFFLESPIMNRKLSSFKSGSK